MFAKSLSILAKYLWVKELGLLNGLALIIALYVHEYGHFFMARQLKLNPQHPRFIPFFGAYVKRDFSFDHKKQFKISFAGPLLGGIVGLISFYVDLIFDIKFFHQLAIYSCLLNFFNLFPFSILDGGKIANTLGYKKIQLFFSIIIIIISFVYKKYLFIILGVYGILMYVVNVSDNEEDIVMKVEDISFAKFIYIALFIVLGFHVYFIFK